MRETVLLVYDRSHPQVGGLERLIAELGSRLSERHRVIVLAKPVPGLETGEGIPGVEVRRVECWSREVRECFAEARCMIGFGFTPQSPRSIYPLVLARRARAAGLPVAWCPTFSPPDTSSPGPAPYRPRWKRLIPKPIRHVAVASATMGYHSIFARAPVIFALTPAEEQHWAQTYPGRIVLTPHGVGARHALCPTGHEARAWCEQRFGPGPHLLTVGRLVESKNQEVLIRALLLVRERWPTARLLLAGPDQNGTGPRLRALAHQAAFAGSVEFLGVVPAETMCRLYAGVSCLLHASRHEASGLTPLEALAHATPAVHSGRGALARYRKLPGCFEVGDPESPVAWASTLLEVLDAPDTTAGAASGRTVVLTEHTWEHMTEVVAAALPRRSSNAKRGEATVDAY